MRASSLASGAPRQKCGPRPNPRCVSWPRAMSKRPASAPNLAGSVPVPPIAIMIGSPVRIVSPPRRTVSSG